MLARRDNINHEQTTTNAPKTAGEMCEKRLELPRTVAGEVYGRGTGCGRHLETGTGRKCLPQTRLRAPIAAAAAAAKMKKQRHGQIRSAALPSLCVFYFPIALPLLTSSSFYFISHLFLARGKRASSTSGVNVPCDFCLQLLRRVLNWL